MPPARERPCVLIAVGVVTSGVLLVLAISIMFNNVNGIFLPLAFLPGFCIAGIGAYLLTTKKDTLAGKIWLVGGSALTFSLLLFLTVLPSLPLENIYIYGQNISLAVYNAAPYPDKVVVAKLKVGEEPKTYSIFIHNSGNKFIVVKLVGKFAKCNVLSGELVNISVNPTELWIAPGKTKSLKLTVYSAVNYTDMCTIRLIFEVS